MKFWSILLLAACFLVYGIFYPIASFALQWDDWGVYWAMRNDFSLAHTYLAHPATLYEFFALSRILSPDSSLWMHMGLILKIILAVSAGKLLHSLTKSKPALALAVIIISVSSIGSDALGFVSAHIVLILGIELCLGYSFWIEYLESGSVKKYIMSNVFFLLALATDLFRVLPYFLLMLFLLSYARLKKTVSQGVRTILPHVLLSVAFVAVFSYLYQPKTMETEFTRQIADGLNFASLKGLMLIFFTSLGIILFSWTGNIPTGGISAWINRGFYFAGFAMLILAVYGVTRGLKNKKTTFFVPGFLLLWIFLFHFPQWFYEPRLIPGSTYRYALLPGIGIQLLLAYYVSRINGRILYISVCAVLFLSSIIQSLTVVRGQRYRNKKYLSDAWSTIDKEIPRGDGLLILHLSGTDPLFTSVFKSAGPYPLALARGYSDSKVIPIIVYDKNSTINIFCRKNGKSAGATTYSLDNLYSFEIQNNGLITDDSENFRRKIEYDLGINGCRI